MFSRQTYYDDDPSADFVFSFSRVGTEPVMMNTCNDIILLHTAVLIYNIYIYTYIALRIRMGRVIHIYIYILYVLPMMLYRQQ